MARLGLGEAYRGDLGVGEGHRGRGPVISRLAGVPEDIGGGDAGLIHRGVGEGALAGDVADGPHALGSTHVPIHLDGGCCVVETDRAHAQRREIRAAFSGDKQMLGRHCLSGVEFDGELLSVVLHATGGGAGVHDDALVGEHPGDGLGGFGLMVWQQPRGRLDDRGVDVESREDLGELHPDRTGAEHEQRPRQRTDLNGVPVGPEWCAIQPVDRQDNGLGTGVEHDRAAYVKDTLAVHSGHRDFVGGGDATDVADETVTDVLEALHSDLVVPAGGGLVTNPVGDRGTVRLHPAPSRELVDPSSLGQRVGTADHHLGRNAGVVRALASDRCSSL